MTATQHTISLRGLLLTVEVDRGCAATYDSPADPIDVRVIAAEVEDADEWDDTLDWLGYDESQNPDPHDAVERRKLWELLVEEVTR